jgi:hypothetical protein
MKKTKNENQKTFSDLTNKAWIVEENTIKIGDSALKLMKGENTLITVKEIYFGDPWQTHRIVIDKEDKLYLLKTSRELK